MPALEPGVAGGRLLRLGVELAASFALAFIGYTQARAFVRERLRYVDLAQGAFAPVIAVPNSMAAAKIRYIRCPRLCR